MANDENLKPFQKGYDSRRGHKPKGAKHVSTWIQELLNDEKFTATIHNGSQTRRYKGAPLKAMIKAQTILAMNGDTRAFDSLLKHGWGKLQPDPPSVSENPIVFINNVPIGSREEPQKDDKSYSKEVSEPPRLIPPPLDKRKA